MKYLIPIAIVIIAITFMLTHKNPFWDSLNYGKPIIETDLHKLTGEL